MRITVSIFVFLIPFEPRSLGVVIFEMINGRPPWPYECVDGPISYLSDIKQAIQAIKEGSYYGGKFAKMSHDGKNLLRSVE